VKKEGKSYRLTQSGTSLVKSLSENVGITMGAWEKLEGDFKSRGVDNTSDVNPATLNT
jgi:hypothetical protein